MEALGHAKYAVVGWSDGAISAVKLAAHFPEQAWRLVIFGGNAYMTEADAVAFEESRDIAGWSERMRNTHLPIYGDDLQPMWSSAVDAWQAIVREHGGDVCMSEAKAIRCPTLVLHGEKDPLCLIEHPHWFNEHITDARMHIFPGGKHNIHQKFADEFNRFVKDFCPAAEYA